MCEMCQRTLKIIRVNTQNDLRQYWEQLHEAAQTLAEALRPYVDQGCATTNKFAMFVRNYNPAGTAVAALRDSISTAYQSTNHHLSCTDITGALADINGVPIYDRAGRRYYDHLGEVQGALNSLVNLTNNLNQWTPLSAITSTTPPFTLLNGTGIQPKSANGYAKQLRNAVLAFRTAEAGLISQAHAAAHLTTLVQIDWNEFNPNR